MTGRGRDRDVGRTYPSGYSKRKAKDERAEKDGQVVKKTPKLTDFFHGGGTVVKSNPINSSAAGSSNAVSGDIESSTDSTHVPSVSAPLEPTPKETSSTSSKSGEPPPGTKLTKRVKTKKSKVGIGRVMPKSLSSTFAGGNAKKLSKASQLPVADADRTSAGASNESMTRNNTGGTTEQEAVTKATRLTPAGSKMTSSHGPMCQTIGPALSQPIKATYSGEPTVHVPIPGSPDLKASCSVDPIQSNSPEGEIVLIMPSPGSLSFAMSTAPASMIPTSSEQNPENPASTAIVPTTGEADPRFQASHKSHSGPSLSLEQSSQNPAGTEVQLAAEEIQADLAATQLKLEINQLSTDIGSWPTILGTRFQNHWINEGSKDCQHLSDNFSASVRFCEADKKNRYCNVSYFTKVHEPTNTKNIRNWLCYSPSRGELFCFHCKVMNSTADWFVKKGFFDWKHANDYIERHEGSKPHKLAWKSLLNRTNKAETVDFGLVKQIDSESKYWRTLLERIVEVVKFLGERGLAFRGDTEIIGAPDNGNYLGLLELLAKFDPFLQAHIAEHGNKGRSHVSYLSKTVCDEFIGVIGDAMLSRIVEELKTYKYYSVSMDSTPDVSHVDQLVLTVRYVTPSGPVERYLTLLNMDGHGAEQITDGLLKFLSEKAISLKDCRGQSYDNASNMSGKYSGVQARIKELNPLAIFVPCFAHSLNLVGKCAVDCCEEATRFFMFLESLYTFFSGSTYRWGKLTDSLTKGGTKLPTIKTLAETRWSARADATKAVLKGYSEIKNALCDIRDNVDQKAECRQRARGLVQGMDKLETGLMLVIWDKLLQRFEATSSMLQSSDQNLNTACTLLKSLHDFVQDVRSKYPEMEQAAMELTGSQLYHSEGRRQRKRNRKYDDECDQGTNEAPDVVQNESQKFQNGTFLVIIDSLLSALSRRLSAYDDVSKKFGFLRQLKSLSADEIDNVAKCIVSAFPDDVDESLSDELNQFSHLLRSEFGENLVNGTELQELQMYQLITARSLQSCFPNVEVILRIYLCLMVTNCSGERSFSKLKRVKNMHRSKMSQDRLCSLMLMAVEQELLREIDVSGIIDSFARAKSRKSGI